MARPTKDPSLVKGEMLKIPLTAGQKELIVGTALAAGDDTAAWARNVLLMACQKSGQTPRKAKR
jgi:hypothetical protein